MSLAFLPDNQTAMQESKIGRLLDRAHMLKEARRFFFERGVTEVDCPLLTVYASVDAHIDLIPAIYHGNQRRYLHSSPEYGMKRLLADGMSDIYQLAHVFRDGECGIKHNPEFMMTEWYRIGFTLEEMIADTVDFVRLFLGNLTYSIVSYRDLFLEYTGIDYIHATNDDLCHYLEKKSISFYPSILEEGKDALLNLILGSEIEPHLGKGEILVLAYYPASQAALAKKRGHGEEQVAERFELYYKGMELANGYHELADAYEQRQRFVEANEARKYLGKNELPIDENFLSALERGLPDCCGVAVGFDRLMMLRHEESNIGEVIPFDWNQA